MLVHLWQIKSLGLIIVLYLKGSKPGAKHHVPAVLIFIMLHWLFMLQEHLGLVFWSIPNHQQLFIGQGFFISSSVEFDREDQSVCAKKWNAGLYPQLRQQLLFYFRFFFALLMPYMIQSLTWFSCHVLVFSPRSAWPVLYFVPGTN